MHTALCRDAGKGYLEGMISACQFCVNVEEPFAVNEFDLPCLKILILTKGSLAVTDRAQPPRRSRSVSGMQGCSAEILMNYAVLKREDEFSFMDAWILQLLLCKQIIGKNE
ncbi:hypothetical protein L6452_14942 [Arctium lappa]|uniref:Uncharacterized protein n=1 Tax=Arctium lappa TaxID=4217 RepID=A0ACB9CMD1_ARCLA|nr:hypothetical protein L6452_14942 [Arctium lappa]